MATVTPMGSKIKKEPPESIITTKKVEAALGEIYFFVMNLNNTDRKQAIEFGGEMMVSIILDNDKVAEKLIKSVKEEKLKVEKYTIRIDLKQCLKDQLLTDEQVEQFKYYLNVGDWIKGNWHSFIANQDGPKIKTCHFCGGNAVMTPVTKKVYTCTKCGAEGETLMSVKKEAKP